MKILHTSDWHLGHTLYNYDRTAEQQAFLRQLTRIVTEEQPDAMVVSGDIYHYSSPAAATQKMYTDAMLNIHQACPGMAIVVTAGNHDSSSKLDDRQQPLAALRPECRGKHRTYSRGSESGQAYHRDKQ
mgnify:CR=1 FL=1